MEKNKQEGWKIKLIETVKKKKFILNIWWNNQRELIYDQLIQIHLHNLLPKTSQVRGSVWQSVLTQPQASTTHAVRVIPFCKAPPFYLSCVNSENYSNFSSSTYVTCFSRFLPSPSSLLSYAQHNHTLLAFISHVTQNLPPSSRLEKRGLHSLQRPRHVTVCLSVYL